MGREGGMAGWVWYSCYKGHVVRLRLPEADVKRQPAKLHRL
jgi:hypothetical protein